MKNQPHRRGFTVAETAAYFSLPANTLYSLAARGRLLKGAILKLGRQLRFDIMAIEKAAKKEEGRCLRKVNLKTIHP
jgi:hypothetical protein